MNKNQLYMQLKNELEKIDNVESFFQWLGENSKYRLLSDGENISIDFQKKIMGMEVWLRLDGSEKVEVRELNKPEPLFTLHYPKVVTFFDRILIAFLGMELTNLF